MSKHLVYTEKEIESNIKTLEDKVYSLKRERTFFTEEINRSNKQIENWNNISKNQTILNLN